MSLAVRRTDFAVAKTFVNRVHRHHRAPVGHKFSLGAFDANGGLIGVAMVGRPVARGFDDTFTLEVTRLATDGTRNACSMLYAQAWQGAKGIGYSRLITYTQDDESGSSLKGAGWLEVARRQARSGWGTPSRPRPDRGTDGVVRILWQAVAKGAPPLPDLSDETRYETGWELQCLACLEPIATPATGRIPHYCSAACRQWAYRRRAAAGK